MGGDTHPAALLSCPAGGAPAEGLTGVPGSAAPGPPPPRPGPAAAAERGRRPPPRSPSPARATAELSLFSTPRKRVGGRTWGCRGGAVALPPGPHSLSGNSRRSCPYLAPSGARCGRPGLPRHLTGYRFAAAPRAGETAGPVQVPGVPAAGSDRSLTAPDGRALPGRLGALGRTAVRVSAPVAPSLAARPGLLLLARPLGAQTAGEERPAASRGRFARSAAAGWPSPRRCREVGSTVNMSQPVT